MKQTNPKRKTISMFFGTGQVPQDQEKEKRHRIFDDISHEKRFGDI